MFSVFVLTIGLMVFLLGDEMALPEGTTIGFIYVFISLISSALTPMLQEHLSSRYSATSSELVLNIYIGSFLISLFLTFVAGEMGAGIEVLRTSSTPFYLLSLLGFCTFAFLGTNSSVGITIRYGALANGICNSCRKVLSIVISILSFPERNGISLIQFFGLSLFTAGLVLKANTKGSGKSTSNSNPPAVMLNNKLSTV